MHWLLSGLTICWHRVRRCGRWSPRCRRLRLWPRMTAVCTCTILSTMLNTCEREQLALGLANMLPWFVSTSDSPWLLLLRLWLII